MGCGGSSPVDTKEPEPVIAPGPPRTVNDLDEIRKFKGLLRCNKNQEEINAYMIVPEAINCVDTQNGNCPIHIAAQNGHVNLIKSLVDKKVSLDVGNKKGNTALHMAIGYDYYYAAKFLIDSGADQNAKNSSDACAINGLENDRSLAGTAVVAATSVNDYIAALGMLKTTFPRGIKKETYIKCGLKMKKENAADWKAKEVQAMFAGILGDFDSPEAK